MFAVGFRVGLRRVGSLGTAGRATGAWRDACLRQQQPQHCLQQQQGHSSWSSALKNAKARADAARAAAAETAERLHLKDRAWEAASMAKEAAKEAAKGTAVLARQVTEKAAKATEKAARDAHLQEKLSGAAKDVRRAAASKVSELGSAAAASAKHKAAELGASARKQLPPLSLTDLGVSERLRRARNYAVGVAVLLMFAYGVGKATPAAIRDAWSRATPERTKTTD